MRDEMEQSFLAATDDAASAGMDDVGVQRDTLRRVEGQFAVGIKVAYCSVE
jgi:hypothetical protein